MLNLRYLPALLLAATLSIGSIARADDACPAIVYPHWALARTALPTRLIANTVVYGYMYLRYGAAYVASLVDSARARPSTTDLYQRPQIIETRVYCPGSTVLVHDRVGVVEGLTGLKFTDPDRRAVYGVPTDATNYFEAAGTLARVRINGSVEVVAVADVGLSEDVFHYPPITARGDDGQVDQGVSISDCGDVKTKFTRVFSLPGQTVTAPADVRVELGENGFTLPVRNVCVSLDSSRQIDVDLRQTGAGRTSARVIGYRGFDQVLVRFADRTTEVVSRKLIIKH